MGDRLPPQNIEAEESILGGILLDPEAIGIVVERMQPDAFSLDAHKIIYRAALTLHTQNKPTDLMSVTTWLADRNLLNKVGGQSKLATLVDRTVSAVNIDQYADLVMDKYLRRELIHTGHEIAQLGYETAKDLAGILDEAEQKVFKLTEERPQQGLIKISDTLVSAFNEIELRNQDQIMPGLACNFYDLDAMTSGFQRSDLIIVAGRPSMGKCLTGDTNILLADGKLATIAEIYQQRQAKLLTLKNNWKFELAEPSAFVDDGIKPVFGVTTKLGRFVESTITHPFLTIKGWRQLEELKLGDKIAVPRQLEVFGTKTLPEDEVKLLGCLLGKSREFIDSNFGQPEDFNSNISNYQSRTTSFNLVIEEAKEIASHNKSIPPIIFQLERSLVALFLNSLFAANESAIVYDGELAKLGYCTLSEKVARQLQHLLLRFGIISTLKKQLIKDNVQKLDWELEITDVYSLKNFINEIGIFEREALIKLETWLANQKDKNKYDLIPGEIWEKIAAAKGSKSWQSLAEEAGINNMQIGNSILPEDLFKLAIALNDLSLQQLATSDVYWDEIVAIESMGYKQVYDLTIPETHNFVANDICVHNTAFSLNIAYNIAAHHKLPVAIFSLEMSKEQLVQRLLASEAEIESNRLRSGRITQNEWETLITAIGSLSDMPIFIDDTPNITVLQMRSQARRLQSESRQELGLILLDYLQLMEGGGDNRVQELSKITRSLKGLARELNVPIIALSQLSRGVEARNNKRPMMSDLRESGSIEQDADLVVMLYRDEYYNPDSPDRGIAEVIIAKHRNGPTGTIKLLFNPQFTQFRNLARPGN